MNTVNTFCDSKLFLSLFLESLGLLVSPEVLLLFLGIDSPKTERADACCLCCNPFIASSCHKFTKEMNLTSYSRVRKTGSVKRKEAHKLCRCTLRGVTLWNGISPGAHLFFQFTISVTWCKGVVQLGISQWQKLRCNCGVTDYPILLRLQPSCSCLWLCLFNHESHVNPYLSICLVSFPPPPHRGWRMKEAAV